MVLSEYSIIRTGQVTQPPCQPVTFFGRSESRTPLRPEEMPTCASTGPWKFWCAVYLCIYIYLKMGSILQLQSMCVLKKSCPKFSPQYMNIQLLHGIANQLMPYLKV